MSHLQMMRIGLLSLLLSLVLTACGGVELPSAPQLPAGIPGLPAALRELPDLVEQLDLPDLGEIAGLPDLDSLPSLAPPPGGAIFRGPTELRLNPGDTIPGTDIRLAAIGTEGAEFRIAGLKSKRQLADSLDYDGGWPGLPGTTYNLRLRIYRLADGYVRAAGVQQLTIANVDPAESGAALRQGHMLRFPHADQAEKGAIFAGTTLGYAGQDERGAEIAGLPAGDYPFRKVGDSILWSGSVRDDIPADFALRVLQYDTGGARVGGIVTLSLPKP